MNKQGILLESGTNEMELVAVNIEDQVFGINVAKVKSIQQNDPKLITPLPESPPGILGMLLYRNHTIPLIDLATMLGKPQSSAGDREIIVITEFNNTINSFKVSGVKQIYRLSWAQLVPINEMLGAQPFVTGSVNIDGMEVLVLDLEYIIATLFPELILKDVSEVVMKKQETLQRHQLRIMFAEDSRMIRKAVVNILQKSGFSEITEFENGQAAYDYIHANSRKILDGIAPVVLISDIEMPKMDGLTLCHRLKKNAQLKTIHVIMFSSLINKQMITKCKRVGADRYVTKPESNDLVQLLDDFLNTFPVNKSCGAEAPSSSK